MDSRPQAVQEKGEVALHKLWQYNGLGGWSSWEHRGMADAL
jgi:hypothetical protein